MEQDLMGLFEDMESFVIKQCQYLKFNCEKYKIKIKESKIKLSYRLNKMNEDSRNPELSGQKYIHSNQIQDMREIFKIFYPEELEKTQLRHLMNEKYDYDNMKYISNVDLQNIKYMTMKSYKSKFNEIIGDAITKFTRKYDIIQFKLKKHQFNDIKSILIQIKESHQNSVNQLEEINTHIDNYIVPHINVKMEEIEYQFFGTILKTHIEKTILNSYTKPQTRKIVSNEKEFGKEIFKKDKYWNYIYDKIDEIKYDTKNQHYYKEFKKMNGKVIDLIKIFNIETGLLTKDFKIIIEAEKYYKEFTHNKLIPVYKFRLNKLLRKHFKTIITEKYEIGDSYDSEEYDYKITKESLNNKSLKNKIEYQLDNFKIRYVILTINNINRYEEIKKYIHPDNFSNGKFKNITQYITTFVERNEKFFIASLKNYVLFPYFGLIMKKYSIAIMMILWLKSTNYKLTFIDKIGTKKVYDGTKYKKVLEQIETKGVCCNEVPSKKWGYSLYTQGLKGYDISEYKSLSKNITNLRKYVWEQIKSGKIDSLMENLEGYNEVNDDVRNFTKNNNIKGSKSKNIWDIEEKSFKKTWSISNIVYDDLK